MPLAIRNSAFIPSANVLAATNKARGMLYFDALVQLHVEYAIQANVFYLKKRHKPPRKKYKGQQQCLWGILEASTMKTSQSPKTTAPRKQKAKKWFGEILHKILYNQIDLEGQD